MPQKGAPKGRYYERLLTVLETNIDDMNPELFPPLMTALLRAGALDAWLSPITMKHGRPAQTLSAICEPEDCERLAAMLFRETSTLGIRQIPVTRMELARELIPVETPYGPINIKVGRDSHGEVLNAAPEFRDCESAAEKHGVPIKTVYREAESASLRLKTS